MNFALKSIYFSYALMHNCIVAPYENALVHYANAFSTLPHYSKSFSLQDVFIINVQSVLAKKYIL